MTEKYDAWPLPTAEQKEKVEASFAASTGSAASPEVQRAILITGELVGKSFQLEPDALEKWLNTNPKGFNYEKWCRAAIAFKRALALPPNDKS